MTSREPRHREKFKTGKALADVETDKAVVSFDATDDGVLAKILVGEGQEADVNQPVGIAVDDVADVPKFASYTSPAAAAPKPVAAAAPAPAASAPVATPPPAPAPATSAPQACDLA